MNIQPPPEVSVVLPAFNAAGTIARAVASIQTQTWADWELLVVDDGSTDGTADILRALARGDSRVRVLARPHAGVVAAANAGLTAARGEFVARMDADDVSHPERLAAQAAFLRAPENRAIDVVGCLVEFGGDRAASAGYALHVDWTNSLVSPEAIALNRFVESPLVNPSAMFRRELVARHGGYRAGDFPEDYELWLRWLDAGVRMAKVPRGLLTWHDAPTRLTRTDARYDPEKFFRLKAEWIAKWLSRNLEKIKSSFQDVMVGLPLVGTPSRLSCAPRDGMTTSASPATGRFEMSSDSELRSGRSVLVWGAGRHTRKRAAHLEQHGVKIAGYIDVDVKKTGRGIGGTGLPVLAPADLPPPGEIFVLAYVSTRGARDHTRGELTRRGYTEGRDFLMCA